MPNKDVFISYKSDEYAQAIWVKDALETNGISCWMAPMSIPGGSSYASEIENAIKGCRVFVLILSKKAQDSRWVTKELDRALNCGKTIMPFDIDNHPLNDAFNFYLTDVQRYEAYTNKSKAFEKMLNEIRKLLTGGTQAPPPIPQPQPNHNPPRPQPQPKPQPKPSQMSKSTKTVLKVLAVIAVAIITAGVLGGLLYPLTKKDKNDSNPNTYNSPEQLLNFSFELDGETYQLPCPYNDFSENGWSLFATEDNDVPGRNKTTITLKKDDNWFLAHVYNTNGNAAAIKDCMVGEIITQAEHNNVLKLSNGITTLSTRPEIVTAFGTNYSSYEGDGYETLRYYTTEDISNSYIEFTCYDSENKNKSSIKIANYGEYKEIDTNETNYTEPEYLKSYVAPTELGGDINSGVIEIDKKLYRLPAPVSEFVDDGWEITDKPEAIVSSGEKNITLKKDGKSISVTLKNLSDYQTVAENCAVISVGIESDVSADLAGGPYIGCSKSLADIVGDEFEVSKLSSYYHYTYSKNDPYIDVSFKVDKESKEVTTVRLYRPDWDY